MNVDVRTTNESLKIIETDNLHRQMYALEMQISPFVEYTDHPANICIGSITILIQYSNNLVYSVTIPVQDEHNKKIIFCSQKTAELHYSFPFIETLAFSPENSHPKNKELQFFLSMLEHPKVASSDSLLPSLKKYKRTESSLEEIRKTADLSSKVSASVKRPSNASSESGLSSVTSAGGFSPQFQHTEQKLVYYLLHNNGKRLKNHIHCALKTLSPTMTDTPSYYGNIVGLMLHVHTRLDVCSNCNDSLVLFRKKALDILNTLPNEEIGSEKASALTSTKDIIPNIPTIEAPVLVTVSSRARNDTNREIAGYDEYWAGAHDRKNHGHINIQLKPEALIRRIDLRENLERIDGIELINTQLASPIKKESSEESSTIDYTNPSPNCHSIFPDVLQRFVFR